MDFDAEHGGLSDASVDLVALAVTPPAAKSLFGWVASKITAFGGKLFGKATLTVDNILSNPSSVKGLTPSQVQSRLKVPDGWKVESLRRGSQKGDGLIIREYTPNGDPTGRMIQWHPGGGHHGLHRIGRLILEAALFVSVLNLVIEYGQ